MPDHARALTVHRLMDGLRDIRAGLARWDLWTFIAWNDIRHRYRRSIIGPFWITISMAILVSALGVLYAMLFRLELTEYLPFVAAGFIIWALISGLISESAMLFIQSEGVIKHIKLPYSCYAFQLVFRNFIIFAHNVVIFVFVALIFSINVGWGVLYSFIGLCLVAVNGVSTALFLGVICARFRDVPQVIANVLQLSFFLTPIIWKPELLQERAFFLWANPFYYIVEVVRAPLLGKPVPAVVWIVVTAITVVWFAVAVAFFARFRHRIAYWV